MTYVVWLKGVLLFLLCMGWASGNAHAQDRPPFTWPLLAPTLEYAFGVPLGVDRLPGLVNRFRSPGTGLSRNHSLYGGVATVHPRFVSNRVGLRLDGTIGVSWGSFESDPFTVELLDSASGALLTTAHQFTVATTLGLARLRGELQWRATRALHIGLGAWGAYRFAFESVEREEILVPATARFPDGARSRIVAAGEDLGAEAFRAGLCASVGFRLPMGSQVMIEPAIVGALDGIALADGLSTRSWSTGLRISLLTPYATNATGEGDVVGRIPGLQLDLYAIDGDNVSQIGDLRAVEMLHRRTVPIIPAIFFDEGSAVIPIRYALINRAAADTFSMAELSGLTPLSMTRRVLDVVGWRLRLATEARISLVASVSTDAEEDLARRRAENVRDYLADVWGIARSRLSVRTESSRPGKESIVEIRSSFPALVRDPVVVEWVERAYQAPIVAMERIIPREGGLRRWEIELVRHGSRIAVFQGEGFPDGREVSGRLLLDSIRGAGEEVPIIGRLSVEDMAGTRDTANDILPLRTVQGTTSTVSGGVVSDGVFGTFDGLTYTAASSDEYRDAIEGVGVDAEARVWGREGASPDGVAQTASTLFSAMIASGLRPISLRLEPPLDHIWSMDDNSPEGIYLSRCVCYRVSSIHEGR